MTENVKQSAYLRSPCYYYNSGNGHKTLLYVAHKLAESGMKDADVSLHTPNIPLVFRELEDAFYIDRMIEDTLLSLNEEAKIESSIIDEQFVSAFHKMMLAANVKLPEIHDSALRMSEFKNEMSSDLIPWEEGGEYDSLDVPPMAAIDES